ncbi:MAG: hypothetical protein EA420_03450 [Candidatus Competibacteraceae bacterium]|nr:MAG: hypothetical protein EA420_03450 [Candidatus Competibacteraceae bacterium]
MRRKRDRDKTRFLRLSRGQAPGLAFGGHGFEMLETSEISEIKQGPYAGEADKTRFQGITRDRVRFEAGE